MTSENAAFENTDSEDDLPMTSLKMKLETQSDNEGEVLDDEEEADLNMTVEAEGDNIEAFGYTTNKIIIGKMRSIKKLKKKFATKKKKKKKKRVGRPNGDEDEQEEEEIEEATPTDLADVSSSDTDGEIPILADIHPPLSHHNQYFKSFKFGPPKDDLIGNKVSEITDGFGEPITVVTIKQEYNEDDDDDLAVDNLNESIDEPAEIKEEPETKIKVKHKHKKIRKDLTDEELVELNVKFIFTCQICPLEFADCVELKTHVTTHDQVGTYLCRMCERVYQNIEDLRLHMASHMRAGSHACSECGKRYHHSQSLVAHRKRWHTAERPFSCHVCAKSYSLKNDLTTHIKCHSQDRFPCQFCDKAFRTDRYLRIHTKHVHLGHKYVTIECEICHKHFQKKNLLNHMKSHEEKIHKCHYCGKCMTTSYSLVAHIRRHEGIKPFVCEICNKAFVDKGKLSRHIHSHAATRDFQCDMCEKSFSEGQYLRQHKRTHDLTREYPCRVCGTKFKSMNSVWSHMRKHTHTNRYECHFCGKTCYRPDHLRSHLISHTGIKDFQCEICSKRFAKSYDLTEHRRSHSGERPYHCLLCQRSFARHGEFRKHKMSKYHREREADAGLAPAVPEAPLPPPGEGPTAPPADSDAPPATPDLSHACPPCDKRFSSAPGLAAHKRRKSHLAKTGQAADD